MSVALTLTLIQQHTCTSTLAHTRTHTGRQRGEKEISTPGCPDEACLPAGTGCAPGLPSGVQMNVSGICVQQDEQTLCQRGQPARGSAQLSITSPTQAPVLDGGVNLVCSLDHFCLPRGWQDMLIPPITVNACKWHSLLLSSCGLGAFLKLCVQLCYGFVFACVCV